MTRNNTALARALVIVAGFAVLIYGCDRKSQTESNESTRTVSAQRVGEVPPATGSTRQQDQPLDSAGDAPVTATSTEAAAGPVAIPGKETVAGESDASATRVIAYYFHRTMRCPTCLSIEKQAREAVEAAYPAELETGKLKWQAVNIEEAGNEHFELDFELSSSALVIVELHGDEVAAWKNLERVWELVEDPLGFQEYVWNELMEFVPG